MSLSGRVRCTSHQARLFGVDSSLRSCFASRLLLDETDLSYLQTVLARVSAIQASKKEPKPTPEKKVRGKKAKSA